MKESGIIYIVHNPNDGEKIYKVGKTSRNIKARIKELTSETSNLGQYSEIGHVEVTDMHAAEVACHKSLNSYRVQANREFFKVEEKELLIEIVRESCSAYIAEDKLPKGGELKQEISKIFEERLTGPKLDKTYLKNEKILREKLFEYLGNLKKIISEYEGKAKIYIEKKNNPYSWVLSEAEEKKREYEYDIYGRVFLLGKVEESELYNPIRKDFMTYQSDMWPFEDTQNTFEDPGVFATLEIGLRTNFLDSKPLSYFINAVPWIVRLVLTDHKVRGRGLCKEFQYDKSKVESINIPSATETFKRFTELVADNLKRDKPTFDRYMKVDDLSNLKGFSHFEGEYFQEHPYITNDKELLTREIITRALKK